MEKNLKTKGIKLSSAKLNIEEVASVIRNDKMNVNEILVRALDILDPWFIRTYWWKYHY